MIKEGKIKKGGLNSRPTEQRPKPPMPFRIKKCERCGKIIKESSKTKQYAFCSSMCYAIWTRIKGKE